MDAKDIVIAIEDYFLLKPRTCYRKRNLREVTKYRNIAAYFLKLQDWNESQIADFFGMDRTTFYKNLDKLDDDIDTNQLLRHQIAELKDIIFGDGAEHNSNQETKVILTHKWEKRVEENIFKIEPIEE